MGDEMCMDFLFYYPAQYRGVDTNQNPQLFAFCGAIATNSPDAVHTLCGGLSQAGQTSSGVPNYLLTGVQVKKDDSGYADPLQFGNNNKASGGQSTIQTQCTPDSGGSNTLPGESDSALGLATHTGLLLIVGVATFY